MSILRSASAAMISLLASNQFIIKHLYTITMMSGGVFRYTDAETDLVVGGNTFSSTDLLIERGQIARKIGLSVDALQVEIWANDSNVVGGMPFLALLHNGCMDAARMKVEQAVMPFTNPTDTSAGALWCFEGRVQLDELTRFSARLTVHHDNEILNMKLPHNLLQAVCWNSLFDANCTLNGDNHLATATVQAGATVSSIPIDLTYIPGYFTGGSMYIASGANAGVYMAVRNHGSQLIQPAIPLKVAPAAGDTISLWPGCDGMKDTCTSKFNNAAHFRGQPFIPVAEVAH